MIVLHGFPRSGHTLKVRLALTLFGLPFAERDVSGGVHRSAEFRALNPLEQVPVIVDGDVIIRDSQAILVYLAAAHRPGDWDGRDPAERGRIAQWLSLSANEIAAGPNQLRRARLFGASIDDAKAREVTARVLRLMEGRLSGRDWLEGGRLTIADLACVPYLALAPEGGVNLRPFPAVGAWCGRLAALPGAAEAFAPAAAVAAAMATTAVVR